MRNEEAYTEWWDYYPFDKRLEIPIIMAFKSGLKYDEDNEKSFAGLTKTLAKFDNDEVMDTYRKAFCVLENEDERLEYILENLKNSSHKSKEDIIFYAANVYIQKGEKALEEDDDPKEVLGGRRNKFIDFLDEALLLLNDRSVEIVHKVLRFPNTLEIFDDVLGSAFRVVSKYKLGEYSEIIKEYILKVANKELEFMQHSLKDKESYNLTEASMAFAKINKVEAQPILEKVFNIDKGPKLYMLDMKAAVCGGFLLIDKDHVKVHTLLERVLNNRLDEDRIYGGLRAVAEVKLDQYYDITYKQLYSGGHCFYERDIKIRYLAKEAISYLQAILELPHISERIEEQIRECIDEIEKN